MTKNGRKKLRQPTLPGQNPTPRQTAHSPSRLWLYRGIAVVVIPILTFLVIEVVLRVCGVGYDTRFLQKTVHNNRTVFAQNNRATWHFLGPALARAPYPFCVPAQKDTNTVRILVLGESAAYGDPHPEFGLARMIEAILSLRHPGTKFEVINAAVTGINSHAIRYIANDCRALDADVWVLYIGNNEVIGPFGPGTVFTSQTLPLWVVRLNLWVKGTRFGQLVDAALSRLKVGPSSIREWAGVEMFVGQKVHPADKRLLVVYKWFRKNLRAIVRYGLDAKATVVVSTVCVNLRDCAPFDSEHRPDLLADKLEQWRVWFEQGKTNQQLGRWQDALVAFSEACKIDDTFAEVRFRRAQCALAIGARELARTEFVAACDTDALRFRCDSRLNAITRAVANEFGNSKVIFADSEAALQKESEVGIPGAEFFYDHVHLTFEGTYHVATEITRQIELELATAGKLTTQNLVRWPSAAECMRRLAWTDWDRMSAYSDILMRIADPPFVWQLNHAEQEKMIVSVMRQLCAGGHTHLANESRAQVELALKNWPDDPLIYLQAARFRQITGDITGATAAFEHYLELVPTAGDVWRRLGRLQLEQGDTVKADASLQRALALDNNDAWTLHALAKCYLRQAETDKAQMTLNRLLQCKPSFGPAWIDLGEIYEQRGRTNDAIACYQRALTNRVLRLPELVQLARLCRRKGWFDHAIRNYADAIRFQPTDPQLRIEASRVLAQSGKHTDAIAQLEAAVDLAPDQFQARFLLGYELGAVGRHAEAVEQFRHVVRLRPDLAEGHVNLGVALMNAGQLDEALDVFESVLRRWPTNEQALINAQALRARLKNRN